MDTHKAWMSKAFLGGQIYLPDPQVIAHLHQCSGMHDSNGVKQHHMHPDFKSIVVLAGPRQCCRYTSCRIQAWSSHAG